MENNLWLRGMFRGKRCDNSKWIEGFLAFDEYCNSETPYIGYASYDVHNWVDVDPDTVGQCTGLRDKNNAIAYEGDVIRTHYANAQNSDHVETIVFRAGRFCAEGKIGEMGRSWALLADGTPHLVQNKSVYMDSFEIIGNIHDNPELLSEGVR